jgi:hypothetical protein
VHTELSRNGTAVKGFEYSYDVTEIEILSENYTDLIEIKIILDVGRTRLRSRRLHQIYFIYGDEMGSTAI